MVLVRVFVIRDRLLAVVADVVLVRIYMVRDRLLAVVADVVLVRVFVIRDRLLADVADVVLVYVSVVGSLRVAGVAQMIVILVEVIQPLGLFRPANCADVPMLISVDCPFVAEHMRAELAVDHLAGLADRFFHAGCCAAGAAVGFGSRAVVAFAGARMRAVAVRRPVAKVMV